MHLKPFPGHREVNKQCIFMV